MGPEHQEPDDRWRKRARRVLENYFEKRSFPRLILTLLLLVTGASGFLTSIGLLHTGVDHMWIRYPIAVLGAYGIFLGLIRLWVQFEKYRFHPDQNEIQRIPSESTVAPFQPTWKSGHKVDGSWLDFLDVTNLFDLDEGCVFVLLGAALVGIIATFAVAVASASTLTAELFIDAFLVSVLYRKLRRASREHWLGTALRKTSLQAFIVAALFGLIGGCLDYLAPGSRSIGPAIQQIWNGSHPSRL